MFCFSSLGTPHVVDTEYKKGLTIFTLFSQIPPVISHNPKLFITQHRILCKVYYSPEYKKWKKHQKSKQQKTNQPSGGTIRFQEDTNLKRDDHALAVGEGWNAVPQAIQSLFLPRGTVQPGTLLHSLVTAL